MADYQHQPGSVDESSKVFLGDGMSAIADIPSLPTSSHNNDNNNNNNNNNNANNTNTNNTNNNNNNNSAGSTNNNTSPELNTSPQNDLVPQAPQFKSALSYTEVRDYAYPDFHPLHYGVPLETEEFNDEYDDDDDVYEEDLGTYPDSYMRDGGPPWKEDSDLASPVVISHAVGDRISKEYEFSVASADEIHGRAVALFDFIPENENEAPLKEGQVIWVSYRHGQGWLVAEDPRTGETGLVPEEYVQIITGNEYLNSQSEHLNGNYTEEDDDEQQKQQDTLQLLEDEELHRQPHQQQNDIDYTEQSSSLPHGGPGASSDADDNNTQHQQPSTQSDDFSQPALNTSVLSEDPEMAKLTTSFETTKWK